MFRVALTCLTILEILIKFAVVDQAREPIRIQTACISMIINAIIIYGLWHWL